MYIYNNGVMREMTLQEKLEYNRDCRTRIVELDNQIADIKIAMIPVCMECRKDGFACDECFNFDGFIEESCE
jgi:hypothetical protein